MKRTTPTSVTPIEIVIEKGKETEIRCTCCGKKLQTIEKTGAFSSKNACIILKNKCTRCSQLNHFIVK